MYIKSDRGKDVNLNDYGRIDMMESKTRDISSKEYWSKPEISYVIYAVGVPKERKVERVCSDGVTRECVSAMWNGKLLEPEAYIASFKDKEKAVHYMNELKELKEKVIDFNE